MEAIALHVASTYGGAQFYISCGQINVSNGGDGTPGPLVSIPGVYTGYVRFYRSFFLTRRSTQLVSLISGAWNFDRHLLPNPTKLHSTGTRKFQPSTLSSLITENFFFEGCLVLRVKELTIHTSELIRFFFLSFSSINDQF